MTWLRAGHWRDSGIETFPGCYNTGHSPAVYRFHDKHGLTTRNDVYLVGNSGDIKDSDMRVRAVVASWEHKSKIKCNVGFVHIYKTMASARAKYDALCNEALTKRAANDAKRAAIAAKARAGDVGAVLALGLDW